MTFVEMQDAVMSALNLTSDDARTRIKTRLNLRLREIQSTLNLARTRRNLGTVTTVSGQATVTVSGVAKIFGLYDDETHQTLEEIAMPVILNLESESDHEGIPRKYAIQAHVADVVVLRFNPTPNAAYELQSDTLAAGTDLVDDEDEPTFPVDFHDVPVRGVLADEYRKLEKFQAAAKHEEAMFEKRLSELRYFIVKSQLLNEAPKDMGVHTTLFGRRTWPYGGM